MQIPQWIRFSKKLRRWAVRSRSRKRRSALKLGTWLFLLTQREIRSHYIRRIEQHANRERCYARNLLICSSIQTKRATDIKNTERLNMRYLTCKIPDIE